jgi:hypothetical protein
MRPISLLHAFACGGKHRAAGDARLCQETFRLSALPFRAPHGARVRPLLRISQTLAQRLEVIEPGVIDFGMVTAQDDLMLVVAENAALEFTGYGHGEFLIAVR